MPNKPHIKDECDEDCSGCVKCYLNGDDTGCSWTCPHGASRILEHLIDNVEMPNYYIDAIVEWLKENE